MNAEIFEKKEYADSVARVDFVRVCTLVVNDKFMAFGHWWFVYKIEDGRIFYKNELGTQDSLGAKSQMFVQITKDGIL